MRQSLLNSRSGRRKEMPPCFCNMLNIYILSFQVELQEYDMSKSLNSTQFGKTSIVFKFLNSFKTQISRSQIMQAPLKTLFQINTFFFSLKIPFFFLITFLSLFLHLSIELEQLIGSCSFIGCS